MHRAVTGIAVSAFERFQRALDVGVTAVFTLERGEQAVNQRGIQQGVAFDIEMADVDQGSVAAEFCSLSGGR